MNHALSHASANAANDPIMILTPQELAADMIATFREQMDRDGTYGHGDQRYAVHRAAEVRAWELHKQYGGYEASKGKHFARAAIEIAEYYHDVPWKDEQHSHHVPLLKGLAS